MNDTGAPSATALLRWRLACTLLDEALDQAPEAVLAWREALNHRQPAPDAEVLAELDQLLEAHATAHGDDPLAAAPALGARSAPRGPEGPRAGQRIGPWELVSRLGEGGMAEVWRARRADGAYDREVALKLPRQLPWRSDLGERMARERDILARLSHPHIARLYDAGVSAVEGQGGAPHPWLAMELVDGTTLVEWCNARRLPLRERVQLFLQVLGAVAHAHAMLVLHRDIKPSNILVNAAGEVRLLDFGIAKLLDEEARKTTDTRLTQFGGRALTPDYASPEQLRGEPLTTASDVYSLGVVLCELLCGELPYRLRHRSAAQMETAVLEAEPKRPSTRPEAHHAEARGLTPGRLARELRGDLDAIVLTALRKAAGQRYDGAAEFKADLQRWLDGLPVLAQPDSLPYRVALFVRRHRLGVTAAAGVASVLLATTLVSVHQSQVARREASRAQATRDFLMGLYKPVSWLGANPARGGQVTARELLDLSAEQLKQHPVSDPDVQMDVQRMLYQLYADVGDLRGRQLVASGMAVHARQMFGDPSVEFAEALLAQAEALMALDQGAAHASLDQAKGVMTALPKVPSLVQGRYKLIEAQVAEAQSPAAAASHFLEATRALSATPKETLMRVQALTGYARTITLERHRLREAKAAYEQAVALLKADPAIPVFALTEPEAGLADVNARLGNYRQALALYSEAHERCEKLLGPGHVDSLQTGYRLGLTLWQVGRPKEALDLLDRMRGLAVQTQGQLDGYTLPSIDFERGNSLSLLGRYAQARAAHEAAIEGMGRVHGDKPTVWRALWLARMVPALASSGDLPAARATLQRALSDARAVGTSGHLEKLLALAAAVVEVAKVTGGDSLNDALKALAEWERLERTEAAELSVLIGQRTRARLALWRAEAYLLANKPADAAAELRLAMSEFTPDLLDELGRIDQGVAAELASEVAVMMGNRSLACLEASTAQATLKDVAPGHPHQEQAARLLAVCSAKASAPHSPAAHTMWSRRWAVLEASLQKLKP